MQISIEARCSRHLSAAGILSERRVMAAVDIKITVDEMARAVKALTVDNQMDGGGDITVEPPVELHR